MEMQNSLVGVNNRMEMTKDRVSKPEDRAIEIIHLKKLYTLK